MSKKVLITLIFLILSLTLLVSASVVDKIIERINEVVCILLCIIWYIIAGLAALLLLLAGVKYITSESEEGRKEAKGRITQIITGLIIVIIALPLVNFIIQNTKIMKFGKDCNCLWMPASTTTTTTTISGTTTIPVTSTISRTTTTLLPCVAFSPPNCAGGSCPPGLVCMEVGGTCQCQTGVTTSTIFTTCENECILNDRPGGSCRTSCSPSDDIGQNGCPAGKRCCCNPTTTTTSTTSTTTTTTSSTTTTTSLPLCYTNLCPEPEATCKQAAKEGWCGSNLNACGAPEGYSSYTECCCDNYLNPSDPGYDQCCNP